MSIFAGQMLDRQPVTIFGGGEQTRDFVFVEDVVDAYLAVLDRGDGQRINVGTGVRTSVDELFAVLADLIGYDRPPVHAPARAGELQHIALAVERARRELCWAPRTTLRDGLATTVAWLRGELATPPAGSAPA